MGLLLHTTKWHLKLAGKSLSTINFNLRLPRICEQTLRPCSQLSSKKDDDLTVVYKFPHIVAAKVVCKLKLYQTGVVLGLAGFSLFTDVNIMAPVAVGSASLVMLGIMGEYFRRLVGIVYFNPETGDMKIAHLNFWGNRVDRNCSYQDVIPLSDIGETSSDLYVKLKFYDPKFSPLYMSLRYGKIVDKKLFDSIFGTANWGCKCHEMS